VRWLQVSRPDFGSGARRFESCPHSSTLESQADSRRRHPLGTRARQRCPYRFVPGALRALTMEDQADWRRHPVRGGTRPEPLGVRLAHPPHYGSGPAGRGRRFEIGWGLQRLPGFESQRFRHLPVAQRTEWMATNHQVAGSTPAGETPRRRPAAGRPLRPGCPRTSTDRGARFYRDGCRFGSRLRHPVGLGVDG
jgi:hypothetical protein